jgi:hypothetical protein
MKSSLDTVVGRCPMRGKVLGFFGRRCTYTNTRCMVSDNVPLSDCNVYTEHGTSDETPDVVKVISLTPRGIDEHEDFIGIGASDLSTVRRHMYGR